MLHKLQVIKRAFSDTFSASRRGVGDSDNLIQYGVTGARPNSDVAQTCCNRVAVGLRWAGFMPPKTVMHDSRAGSLLEAESGILLPRGSGLCL